jgi:hypothetical protein
MILNKLTVEQQTMVQCIDDDQSQEVDRRHCTTLVIPALDIENQHQMKKNRFDGVVGYHVSLTSLAH